MVERLISTNLVPGVHFCTLNLEKSVRTILENLGWVSGSNQIRSSPLPRHNQLIEDDTNVKNGVSIINGISSTAKQTNGLSISPSEASQLAQWGLTNNALPPAPKKGLGNSTTSANGPQGPSTEDSWDEYPNGRFTDVRSPAYGEIDGWGGGIKMSVRRDVVEIGVSLMVRKGCTSPAGLGYPNKPCGTFRPVHLVLAIRPYHTHYTLLRPTALPRIDHHSAKPRRSQFSSTSTLDSRITTSC